MAYVFGTTFVCDGMDNAKKVKKKKQKQKQKQNYNGRYSCLSFAPPTTTKCKTRRERSCPDSGQTYVISMEFLAVNRRGLSSRFAHIRRLDN